MSTNDKRFFAHDEKPKVLHNDYVTDRTSVSSGQDSIAPELGEETILAARGLYKGKLRGRKLTFAIAVIAGVGFTLFGYDQGVLSSLLSTKTFEETFPQTVSPEGGEQDGHAATLQSFLVAIYELGCLAGALSNLWVGDLLGRRHTICLGGAIMTVGAILQTAAVDYAMMLVARVVTGVGNGLLTSTVPSYQSECAHPEKRGKLVMIEGALITFGIMISYWIDFGFYWIDSSSIQWRFPVAFQIVFAIFMIAGMYGLRLPESPRYLVRVGRNEEALAVLAALDDVDVTDQRVVQTWRGICDVVNVEDSQKFSFGELFTHGRGQNFRRTILGIAAQAFQQLTGINLITYYATLLFERLDLGPTKSRILSSCNGTEYFLASLVAIYVIETLGRRKLMLVGAVGQAITMGLLAALDATNTQPGRYVSAVLLFVFNSFFAFGWLGMTWLYPAEIVGLRIRQPANALSTASNWIFNFLVVMITGPAFANIQWGTYALFAVLNALLVPSVYFFFPETKGRSLEEMDLVFAKAHNDGVSPVKVALQQLPAPGSVEAEMILGRDDVIRQRQSGRKREDDSV